LSNIYNPKTNHLEMTGDENDDHFLHHLQHMKRL
jgi:hypothetical protein